MEDSSFLNAVGNDDVEMMQWLVERECPENGACAYMTAAQRDAVGAFAWLKERYKDDESVREKVNPVQLFRSALYSDCLRILDYMHAQKMVTSESRFGGAIHLCDRTQDWLARHDYKLVPCNLTKTRGYRRFYVGVDPDVSDNDDSDSDESPLYDESDDDDDANDSP